MNSHPAAHAGCDLNAALRQLGDHFGPWEKTAPRQVIGVSGGQHNRFDCFAESGLEAARTWNG